MCRKKLALLLILFLFLTSSCNNTSSKFCFDNSITWESSVSDVISKYGTDYNRHQTYTTIKSDTHFDLDKVKFPSHNCCGYDGFDLEFTFSSKNKDICYISITSVESVDLTMFQDITNALMKKYGEPYDIKQINEKDTYTNWNLDDQNAYITCYYNQDDDKGFIWILYRNKKYDDPTEYNIPPTNGI